MIPNLLFPPIHPKTTPFLLISSDHLQYFHPIANLLEKGIHYSLAEEGRVLRLFGLTHQGTRQYRCSAINGAGMDEMDFAISVIRPPILSREVRIRKLKIGKG